MATTDTGRKPYDAELYWSERYSVMDITRSGHINLPVEYNRWLYRRKQEILAKALGIAGFRAQGASILEVAAGTGVYVQWWETQGVAKIVGIDISAAAVEDLKKRFPQYAFYKRDLALPGLAELVGTSFDLVTAVDMLYHIVKDEDFPVALENLAQTVKPGGLLAIHDHFLNIPEMDLGHIKLRTLERYRAALDAAGFEIVARIPTFFFMVERRDTDHWRLRIMMDWIWNRITLRLIWRYPNRMGKAMYWVDRFFGLFLSEGPSFEMMVCRRR